MEPVKIALLGDLMIGRTLNVFGNVKALEIYKKECKSVHSIVRDGLRHRGPSYVWGDLLSLLLDSHFRIANLEGVFCSGREEEDCSPYMHKIHPCNIEFLKEARISCCTLANNHILDCGLKAVRETVDLLSKENIKWCGFGNGKNCWRPAILKNNLSKSAVTELTVSSESNTENVDNLKGISSDSLGTVCSIAKHSDKTSSGTDSVSVSKPQNDPSVPNDHQSKDSIRDHFAESQTKIAVFAIADHFREWAAEGKRAGVNYFDIENFTHSCGNPNRGMWTSMEVVKDKVEKVRPSVDIVIFSIHWGDNFGWVPSPRFQEFAHGLVDLGVDVVFGHSSHHSQGIEVYKGRFILYGCGDFLNDYQVYEQVLSMKGETLGHEFELYKSNLSFLYILHWCRDSFDPSCQPAGDSSDEEEEERTDVRSGSYSLELIPVKIHNCQVSRATGSDAQWLMSKMEELCVHFNTQVNRTANGTLVVDGTPPA